jgi:amino acid permease
MMSPDIQRKLLLAAWYFFPVTALALLVIMGVLIAHGRTGLAMYLWPPVLAVLIVWSVVRRAA